MSFDAKKVIDSDRAHVWHHLSQHKAWAEGAADPIIFVEGKGMRVTDVKGNEYLDAVSGGVWTVNVGYGRKEIVDAVAEQLQKLCYFANSFGSIPGAMFAEKLIEKMPGMNRVYFSNSGSEANEKAFKIVRQISQLKYDGKKYKIMFRNRDYHGTTITALSATGQEERKMQFGPFTPGFVEFPAANPYRNPWGLDPQDPSLGKRFAEQFEEAVLAEGPETVGGAIIEPITAGGGVLEPPKDYFKYIREICDKYNILLIIDEVVCGLGRTGKWFGYQHFDFQPDIVTMAKGVASGYAAISCTVTTEAVFNDFIADPSDRSHYFRDISTFGGCTAGPAAALANVKIIEDENILDNVVAMGEYFLSRMLELKEKYAFIGDVRGKGLFCGMELVKDRETKEPVAESVCNQIAGHCMSKSKVIIGKTTRSFAEYNNTLCFSPALICTKADLDEIIAAVDAAMAEVQI